MSGLTWAVAAVVLDGTGRVLLCRQGHGERRWALPGGRLRSPRCPATAVAEAVRRETGQRIEPVELVGLYHLAVGPCLPGERTGPAPDVVVHVFRAHLGHLMDGSSGEPADRTGPRPADGNGPGAADGTGSQPAGRAVRGPADAGYVLGWHHPDALPARLTPVTRAALADALAGRSGVLRGVRPDGTGSSRPDRVPLPGQSDPLTTPGPRPEPAARPRR